MRREDGMSIEYDKNRTAALIKEAREITDHLKNEMEGLRRQVACVLDGGRDEAGDAPTDDRKAIESSSITKRAIAAKLGWSWWR
jgi:hypothetical protein